MAERNSKLLEILFRQLGKNLKIDIIVGENACQWLQTKLPEPILQVGHSAAAYTVGASASSSVKQRNL